MVKQLVNVLRGALLMLVVSGACILLPHKAYANGGLTLSISVTGFPGSSVMLNSKPHTIGACGSSMRISIDSSGNGIRQCISDQGKGIGSPDGTVLVAPDANGYTGTWSTSNAIGNGGTSCLPPMSTNSVCINMPPDNNVTFVALTVSYTKGTASTSTSNCNLGDAAEITTSGCIQTSVGSSSPRYACGSRSGIVFTTINFGCKGNSCNHNSPQADVNDPYCQSPHNGIIDLIFSIIRFLSAGVGIIIIASMIVAGIQYTSARGDPNAVAKAQLRIRSNVVALLIYIFAYAILNYLIPIGLFKQ